MNISSFILCVVNFMWNGPILLYVCVVGIILTMSLRCIQLRGLFDGVRLSLFPSKSSRGAADKADLSPFQAFLNALNTSLGNGSLAGMGTAVATGGPGAVFWVAVAGFFMMIIRFAEVYLGSYFIGRQYSKSGKGGPIAYLSLIPGGKILPYLFALFCMFYGFASGNAMQCNSIKLAISRMFVSSNVYVIAAILLLFIVGVVSGGAKRIIAVSDRIVGVKVFVFFVSAIALLVFHYSSLLSALNIIFISAFSTKALVGGAIGASVQKAIQLGFSRSVNATEAGLGIAALLFGAAGKKEPMKNGLMSVFGTFVSNYLVCFILGLCIVASGAWTSGLNSTGLTMRAYETAFGIFGQWIVLFCTLSFGVGVLVAYAYIARECWLFLTGGRYVLMFNLLYCIVALLGTLGDVSVVWGACDLVNICLLLINLFGIICLLPIIKKGVIEYLNR